MGCLGVNEAHCRQTDGAQGLLGPCWFDGHSGRGKEKGREGMTWRDGESACTYGIVWVGLLLVSQPLVESSVYFLLIYLL